MLHVEEVLLLLLASDGGGEGCRDLASQLLILGPGRKHFSDTISVLKVIIDISILSLIIHPLSIDSNNYSVSTHKRGRSASSILAWLSL